MNIRFTRRVVLVIIFSGLLLQIMGCVSVESVHLSRPQITKDYQISRGGRLDLTGLQIYVRPQNIHVTGDGINWFGYNNISTTFEKSFLSCNYYSSETKRQKKEFFIEVLILAEHKLVSNFEDVLLVTSSGEIKKPIAYLGPMKKRYFTYASNLCKTDSPEKKAINIPVTIQENKSACVALVYNIAPPDPKENFSLAINGLKINNNNLELSPIVFELSKEFRNIH